MVTCSWSLSQLRWKAYFTIDLSPVNYRTCTLRDSHNVHSHVHHQSRPRPHHRSHSTHYGQAKSLALTAYQYVSSLACFCAYFGRLLLWSFISKLNLPWFPTHRHVWISKPLLPLIAFSHRHIHTHTHAHVFSVLLNREPRMTHSVPAGSCSASCPQSYFILPTSFSSLHPSLLPLVFVTIRPASPDGDPIL